MNKEFDADYFSGWGTDGYIDEFFLDLQDISLDIEENAMLLSFATEMDVNFTIDPTHENGDFGAGMLREFSSTTIELLGNITYLIDDEEFTDYVEGDSSFI